MPDFTLIFFELKIMQMKASWSSTANLSSELNPKVV